MENILLQPSYFSPIAQYAAILQSKHVCFELADHFQKQTYRTRCYIYSPHGKQLLNVPIQHAKNGKKTKTKDVKIDYQTAPWQKIHLKSLQAGYRSSPFYEYYEDDLSAIFQKKHLYLFDLHLDVHEFVMEALEEKCEFTTTQTFDKHVLGKKDLRNLVNAKEASTLQFPNYVQMFDKRHGFLENLSILDLLFMEGPAASIYLLKIDFSK